MSNKPARVNEEVKCRNLHSRITPQAEVHLTVHIDKEEIYNRMHGPLSGPGTPYRKGRSTRSCYNALRGELAFSRTSTIRNTAQYDRAPEPTEHMVPVWTSFNALPQSDMDAETCPFVFQGVVLNGYHGDESMGFPSADDPAMSVQQYGTTTIFNTGPLTINQGDYVYWDFPDILAETDGPSTRFGMDAPGDKFVAKTVPAGAFANLRKIVAAVADGSVGQLGLRGSFAAVVAKFTGRSFLEGASLYEALCALRESHCIGKALSTAHPGQKLDIAVNQK